MPNQGAIREPELERLLEAIAERYGFDFRGYARGSLRRRVQAAVEKEGLHSIPALQARILADEDCLTRFVANLSVSVTSMFRDPGVYRAFRAEVVPLLRTYPFLRFWHAGCSTGEEVYAMAILLREEGLYERSLLYATDISDETIRYAKRGVFPLDSMRKYIGNYHEAGGLADFSDYYVADHDGARMRESLRTNIVFAQHSLVTDASFNDFHVIFCRNVLIYFGDELRNRVHRLLYGSLHPLGFLVLGLKESIDHTPRASAYQRIDAEHRIYRRVR